MIHKKQILHRFYLMPLLLSPLFFFGQQEILSEQTLSFPTYNFGDPNPLPAFLYNPKIYPYFKFQGYAFKKSNIDLRKLLWKISGLKLKCSQR